MNTGGLVGKFATAVNCIDGRTQMPVFQWAQKNFSVLYVDMITEPGMDKLVSGGDPKIIQKIKQKIGISVEKHGSEAIVIARHDDCAGNPVSQKQHRADITKAAEMIVGWKIAKRVAGVYVGKNHTIETVCDISG